MLHSAFGKIKTKLKSDTGASLMVALLFFILCAVVGSVIIAAASSASGRMAGNRTAVQNRYALRSAEKLVKAQLGEAEYVNTSIVGDVFSSDDNSRSFRGASGTDVTGTQLIRISGDPSAQAPQPSDIAGVVGLMADQVYWASWNNGEGIQSTWPDSGSDDTVIETGGTAGDSSGGITWGFGDDKTEMLTLELSESNGINKDRYKAFNVDVEMRMLNDFSIYIVLKLSENNTDTVPPLNNHTGSGIILKATPFVNVQYDALKEDEGSDGESSEKTGEESNEVVGEGSSEESVGKGKIKYLEVITTDITWSAETTKEIHTE